MGRSRRRSRSAHPSTRGAPSGRCTPPQPPRGSLVAVEGVTVDGEPFVVLSWLCDDPACTEEHG